MAQLCSAHTFHTHTLPLYNNHIIWLYNYKIHHSHSIAKFCLHGNFIERNFQLFISRILLVVTVASELILVPQKVDEIIKAMILWGELSLTEYGEETRGSWSTIRPCCIYDTVQEREEGSATLMGDLWAEVSQRSPVSQEWVHLRIPTAFCHHWLDGAALVLTWWWVSEHSPEGVLSHNLLRSHCSPEICGRFHTALRINSDSYHGLHSATQTSNNCLLPHVLRAALHSMTPSFPMFLRLLNFFPHYHASTSSDDSLLSSFSAFSLSWEEPFPPATSDILPLTSANTFHPVTLFVSAKLLTVQIILFGGIRGEGQIGRWELTYTHYCI